MQEKRFLKVLTFFSLLVILILASSLLVSSCQLNKSDDGLKQVTFENITFMDGEEILTPDGYPNPDDFKPEKEGHVFRYWVYKNNTVPTLFKTENYDGSPITLYASWKANEYTVKFVDADGRVHKVDGKTEQKIKHGLSATAPADPQVQGYKFVGWDKSFGSVTQDLTITARYEKIESVVSFVMSDEVLVQKSVYFGDKIINIEKEALSALSFYTSRGLTLEGWYADSSLKTKLKIDDITITDDFTAYAKLVPSELENLLVFSDSQNILFEYSESLEITVNCSYKTYNEIDYKIAWYIDGVLITGNDTNKITIKNPSVGTYSVKAEITVSYGGFSLTQSKSIELVVSKKVLNVSVNDLTISYGDEKPQFSYSIDSSESIDLGTAIFSCSYRTGDPIGEYPITIGNLSSSTFDLSLSNGTLKVIPKEISVKVENMKVTYGDSVPDFKYFSDGLLSNDILSGGEFACNYTKGMAVGKYVISVSGIENQNYNIVEYVDGTLTVEKMELQIKIESKSTVYYGDPKPVFEYKILKGEVLEGDTLGKPNYICSYTEGAKAQRYTVTLTGLSNPNYNIQTSTGWLTVYPKEVRVNWTANDEYMYDGANQSESVKADYTDVNGEIQVLIPIFELTGEETPFVNAGEYMVSVKSNDSNYKLLDSEKTLVIKKRPITINVHNMTIMYGEDIPEYEYTAVGIMGNDDLGKVEFDCSYKKGSKIGSYQLKAVDLENPNYEISYNNAILTVVKRLVKIEWSIGESYTYNGKVQSDTIHALFKKYDGKNTVMTLTYFLSDKVAGFKNAGTYRVVASTEDTNYEFEDSEKIITIEPKALLLTLDNKTVTYGDIIPTFNFHTEGLVSGESDSVLGKPQYVCEYAQGKDAGEFEISCKPLTNQNYAITYENATLTVNKMIVEAIWSFEDSYTYNGQSQSDTISVKIRGYAGNYLSMNVAFVSGDNTDFYHAGIYTVTAYSEDEKNYTVNHKERIFEIAQKKATLSAVPKTIAYGDLIPEFSYDAYGLESNDYLGKMSYNCMYVQGSPSAEYEIFIVPFECNDYDLSYESATLSVTNRIVEIVWENLDGYIYNKKDQSNNVLAKFMGFDGEYETAELSFVLNGKETIFENAGVYSITATHFDKNYTLLNDTKTLSIDKKVVSVTTKEFTLTYGDEIPSYDYVVVGLEEQDFLIGESYTCSYVKGSNVGVYELSVDFSEQDNYFVTTTSSSVTVNALTVSVVWDYGEIIYNGRLQNDKISAKFETYDGNLQGVNLSFTQNNQSVSFKNVGDYLAKVDYQNENYILTNTEIGTSILPKDITVVLQDKSTVYGDTVEFTHSVIGLVDNENESVLGNINYLCNYEKGSPIGTYSINGEGFANPNYQISYLSANLIVGKRSVNAEWRTNANYVYNGTEQVDSVSVSYLSYLGEAVQMSVSITSGNSLFKNAGDYVFTATNDDDNYSVSELTKKITINKANYEKITHGELIGTYDPDLTLEKYSLNDGFVWLDGDILPTVKQKYYKALYNVDSENYNDYELYIKLTLAKADFKDITHKALNGVYDEKKALSSYVLSVGFTWENVTIVPTVDKTEYNATYNIDKDNYNDFNLVIELNLEKAKYTNITHKAFSGKYSATESLSRFVLNSYYSWVDENIIPTVSVTRYKAIYNRDSVNYEDYVLDITVKLSKADYKQSEIPVHTDFVGTYNPNGKLSDFELDNGFAWKNGNTIPTVSVTRYEATYNVDKANYNDFTLYITVRLEKADYGNVTHKTLYGKFDPNKTLSDYVLDKGFTWENGNIVPTSEKDEYLAIYNLDSENYNDKTLYIKLVITKVDYTGEIPEHPEISVRYDSKKTLADYELEEGFSWVDPTFTPTLGREEYDVYYNPNPYGYNSVKTTVVLITTIF